MTDKADSEPASEDQGANVVALRPAVHNIEVDIHTHGLRLDVTAEVLRVFSEKFPDAVLAQPHGKQPFMRFRIPIRVEGRARRLP